MAKSKTYTTQPEFTTEDSGMRPLIFDIFNGTPFFGAGVIIDWAYKGIIFDNVKYNAKTVTIYMSVPEQSFSISGEKLASDFKEYISGIIKNGFEIDTMIMCNVRKGESWNGMKTIINL
jgi:hypothetical protein